MKRITLLLVLFLSILLPSCKKEKDQDQNQRNEPVCPYEEPTPLSLDGSIPDISWTDYNSVHDACFHFERLVNPTKLAANDPCFEHSSDTLKVCGWLYNSKNMITHISYASPYWISNEQRYASGNEPYPPQFEYGEGILLDGTSLISACPNYHEFIKNKCFITGVMSFYDHSSLEQDDGCIQLKLRLKVIDIYFKEDEK